MKDYGVIIRQDVSFTLTGSGWQTPVSLTNLGVRGIITSVKARLHTGGTATAVDLYIADGSASHSPMTSSAPLAEDTVYRRTGAALTASATAASIEDALGDQAAPYYVELDGNLKVGANVTGSGGTLIVSVYARVAGTRPAV